MGGFPQEGLRRQKTQTWKMAISLPHSVGGHGRCRFISANGLVWIARTTAIVSELTRSDGC